MEKQTGNDREIKTKPTVHGVQRGLDAFHSNNARTEIVSDKNRRQFEGKFGRMFPDLDGAVFNDKDLKDLAKAMVSEFDFTPESDVDDEENPDISAGYTYLGQFIDHDLTFDPTTLSQKQIDPDALVDYRTPAFDLDNIYGRGPDDQPYFYEDGMKFLLGKKLFGNPIDPNTHDLPRSTCDRGPSRALIGDPRNDENIIVSQLQGIFLRFHNSIVDYHRSRGEIKSFDEVRNEVHWHYQWMIINDFLPAIIQPGVIRKILPHLEKGGTIHDHKPVFTLLKNEKREPYMPIEFSVAAYRFGHSMVRPMYRLNLSHQRMFIFPDLVGFDAVPDNLAIDWRLFFDIDGNKPGAARIQPSYKIDTSLVNPLGQLPHSVAPSGPPSLAERNLKRGSRLSLPSGQAVARKLGIQPIPDNKLTIEIPGENGDTKIISITDISKNFEGKAPLWFYVLAESMQGKENRLGEVGGHIVAEVFLWLMLKDPTSIFWSGGWTPIKDFAPGGKFGIAELILQAQRA